MSADPNSSQLPSVALISCAVIEDEVRHFASQLPNLRHIEMLPQGLHNEPQRLRSELQAAIDRIETTVGDVDVISLGYGLCSRGTEGVATERCRLVMPRAHDCITLLMGSRQRYAEYVARHPGTYWYSPGWNRHHTPPGKQRYETLRRKYAKQYGEDNADFLMESEQHWFSTYTRATYVDITIGVTDADLQFTRECARWLNWTFDHQSGDPALLHALLSGPWDDDRFLVLKPGERFTFSADPDRIIRLDDASAPCNGRDCRGPSVRGEQNSAT